MLKASKLGLVLIFLSVELGSLNFVFAAGAPSCEFETMPKTQTAQDFAVTLNRLENTQISSLFNRGVLPVLEEGGRVNFAHFALLPGNKGIVVTSQKGEHSFEIIASEADEEPKGGSPVVELPSKSTVRSQFKIASSRLTGARVEIQSWVRSAFRSDPWLSPGQNPPLVGWQTKLTNPQQAFVDWAMSFEKREDEAISLALVSSTGTGKTRASTRYIRELTELKEKNGVWKAAKKPKVLFVVQRTGILNDAVGTYQRELGMTRVAKVYGDEAKSAELNSETEMIAVTRSSYHSRMTEINALITRDPEQPWIIVMDEAQHTGTELGEFESIFKDLEGDPNNGTKSKLNKKFHRILYMSATLWHNDKKLIEHIGRVYGTFLSPEELADFQKGNRLDHYSLLMLQRSIEQGYLAPILGQPHIVTEIDGAGAAVDLLNQKVKGKDGAEDVVYIHPKLLDKVAELTQKLRIPNLIDRGVLFAPTRDHAEAYARELPKRLGDKVEVRYLHAGKDAVTGKAVDETDCLDWIRDEGKYSSEKNRDTHKYLIVVDMINEGVDIPGINLIVMLDSYGISMGGFRGYLQELGRGTRLGNRKPGLRLIDFSAFTALLDEHLQFMYAQSSSDNAAPKPKSKDRSVVIIDGKPTSAQGFRSFSRDRALQLGRSLEEQFPDFNETAFQTGALVQLRRFGSSRNIPDANLYMSNGLFQVFHILTDSPKISDEQSRRLRDRLAYFQSKGSHVSGSDRYYVLLLDILKELQIRNIDPKKIHLADEVFKLIKFLYPETPDPTPTLTLSPEQAQLLRHGPVAKAGEAQKDGVLGHLRAMQSRMKHINLNDPEGLSDMLIEIAQQRSEVDRSLISSIKGLAQTNSLFQRANQGNLECRNIIFTGFYLLAAKAAQADPSLDPLKVYEPEVFKRTLRYFLAGSPLENKLAPSIDHEEGKLPESFAATFSSKEGALRALNGAVKMLYGDKADISTGTYARDLMVSIVDMNSNEERKAIAEAIIGRKKWAEVFIPKFLRSPEQNKSKDLYYECLKAAVQSFMLFEDDFDQDNLVSFNEISRFLRLVFGEQIDPYLESSTLPAAPVTLTPQQRAILAAAVAIPAQKPQVPIVTQDPKKIDRASLERFQREGLRHLSYVATQLGAKIGGNSSPANAFELLIESANKNGGAGTAARKIKEIKFNRNDWAEAINGNEKALRRIYEGFFYVAYDLKSQLGSGFSINELSGGVQARLVLEKIFGKELPKPSGIDLEVKVDDAILSAFMEDGGGLYQFLELIGYLNEDATVLNVDDKHLFQQLTSLLIDLFPDESLKESFFMETYWLIGNQENLLQNAVTEDKNAARKIYTWIVTYSRALQRLGVKGIKIDKAHTGAMAKKILMYGLENFFTE